MSYFTDFTTLFFPEYCAACNRSLVKGEESICFYCEMKLPRTTMHDERDNPLERLFWGRSDIEAATSFLKMPKRGMVHQMIHELKYRNNKNVGVRLGKLFGNDLLKSATMNQFDVMIPVPLHPKRLYTRGYNQSDCIVEGLHQTMGGIASCDNLVRIQYNESQTRMGRYERWKNVETIFSVKDPGQLEGKRVLLIDDVITTGSTIEACANVLTQITGVRLCIATLAIPA